MGSLLNFKYFTNRKTEGDLFDNQLIVVQAWESIIKTEIRSYARNEDGAPAVNVLYRGDEEMREALHF